MLQEEKMEAESTKDSAGAGVNVLANLTQTTAATSTNLQ